jgi:hypothetical protein
VPVPSIAVGRVQCNSYKRFLAGATDNVRLMMLSMMQRFVAITQEINSITSMTLTS